MACTTGDATLTVTPGAEITGAQERLPVLVSVLPVEGDERTPSDICCVIDISWSMSMEVKVTDANGTVEQNGLSMLDLAKHAVRTIIRTMGPKDRLAIVQFCRESTTMLPLTEMDEAGKEQAETILDSVGFGNGTNLWKGIHLGLEALRCKMEKTGRIGHMMVLTDGETENKNTVMENLRAYKMTHEGLPGAINTFGFGYEIDSGLLVEISDFSDGAYAFIPDGGFVGTCFVNAVSNLQVTMARDAVLSIEVDGGAELLGVRGGWDHTTSSDGDVTYIRLGMLQFGQTRDVILDMRIASATEPYLFASLEYSTIDSRQKVECTAAPPGDPKGADFVEPHSCRCLLVDGLREAAAVAAAQGSMAKARTMVQDVAATIQASPAASSTEVAALLEDLLGQSQEAFSRVEYWQKWGRHYIPSVVSAHKLQQCNNFKDPGVQVYGSALFQENRDAADAAFDTLPAPAITPAMYRYLGGGQVVNNPAFQRPGGGGGGYAGRASAAPAGASAPAVAPAPPVNMAAYNNRYAGCVDGSCTATLATGEQRPLAQLKRGDVIMAAGADGAVTTAEIICSVRSRCSGDTAKLVELPGVRLTPYHPVHCGSGGWRFPIEVGEITERTCESVFTFVLRGAPAFLVGDMPCLALGHGVAEGAAAHPYFGSGKVLEDLSAFAEFDSGQVELTPECVVRDAGTGLVCRLAPPAASPPPGQAP